MQTTIKDQHQLNYVSVPKIRIPSARGTTVKIVYRAIRFLTRQLNFLKPTRYAETDTVNSTTEMLEEEDEPLPWLFRLSPKSFGFIRNYFA